MFSRSRRLVLFALILLMPIQGAAAALGPLLCFATAGHEAAHGVGHGHMHAAPQHESHPDAPAELEHGDSTATVDFSGHLCCHYSVPAVSMNPPESAQAELRGFRPILSLLATSHVPELPQRPPRP